MTTPQAFFWLLVLPAALRSVALGQPGQKVSTSLAHAALMLQHRHANVFDGIDDWKREVPGWVAADGLEPALERRREHNVGDAFFFTSYGTLDGVVGIGAVGAMTRVLCDEFGVADPRTLPDWKDRTRRVDLFLDAKAELTEVFAQLPSGDIVSRLHGHGIPASEFRLLEEVMFDPEAEAGDLLHVWQHPTLGEVRMPAAPLGFSGAEYRAQDSSPAIGAHTDEVLHELGYDQETIDRLVADGIVRREPDS